MQVPYYVELSAMDDGKAIAGPITRRSLRTGAYRLASSRGARSLRLQWTVTTVIWHAGRGQGHAERGLKLAGPSADRTGHP